MTRIITLQNPKSIGFDLFDRWPHEDQTVGTVAIENIVMATLPWGNIYEEKTDPLVHVMQEAHRVLAENGTLEVNAPHPHEFLGMGHPLQTRIYTEATWYAFGCPEMRASPETTVNQETGEVDNEISAVPLDPREYKWGSWLGVEMGTRFQVMSIEREHGVWTVFYRKIPAKELA